MIYFFIKRIINIYVGVINNEEINNNNLYNYKKIIINKNNIDNEINLINKKLENKIINFNDLFWTRIVIWIIAITMLFWIFDAAYHGDIIIKIILWIIIILLHFTLIKILSQKTYTIINHFLPKKEKKFIKTHQNIRKIIELQKDNELYKKSNEFKIKVDNNITIYNVEYIIENQKKKLI